jgi:hypothetical protein
VSRAFSAWRVVDRDQRAFLAFGLRIARETYDRLWREAGHAPGSPPRGELVDLFDGLWPREYESMHAASVLRDAVTNFEVYLERARTEIGGGEDDCVCWGELAAWFGGLGVGLDSAELVAVRELRRSLTHDAPGVVELGEADVLAAMDVLADEVRMIDPAVWGRLARDAS